MKTTFSLLLAGTALAGILALPPAAGADNRPLVIAQATTKDDNQKPKTPAANQQQNRQGQSNQNRTQQQQPQARPQQPTQQPAQNARPQQQQQPAQTSRPPQQPAQSQQQPNQLSTRPANPQIQQRTQQPSGQATQQNSNRPNSNQPNANQQRTQQNNNKPAAQQNQPRSTQQGQQNNNQPGANRQGQQNTNQPANRQGQQSTQPANRANQPSTTLPTTTQQNQQGERRNATETRDSRDFIRRDNNAPQRKVEDLRKERREVREGNRTVIHEGNRTFVREGNRTIVRHSEHDRFRVGARNVEVEQRGRFTRTVVVRPNGTRIITVTDANGRVIRRIRREQGGREFVIFNNDFGRRRPEIFVILPPPVIHIPRERYIVDYAVAPPPPLVVYETLVAEPVEPVAEHYSLEQVRFSAPLRDRMPRIDLDLTFETGSWQLTPDQVSKLSVIAEGINKAINANPKEVFMIEGYTDAVGSTEDNLSLSDRRAETVAVALSEEFNVPAENLATQGYGEENLKVPTQGPEPKNRRVSVRRVTPLLDQDDSQAEAQ